MQVGYGGPGLGAPWYPAPLRPEGDGGGCLPFAPASCPSPSSALISQGLLAGSATPPPPPPLLNIYFYILMPFVAVIIIPPSFLLTPLPLRPRATR